MTGNQAGASTFKEALNPSNLWQSIVASKDKLMAIVLCFGLGFISGYLFKKYVQLIVTFAVFVLICAALQSLDFINFSLNADKIRTLLGLAPTTQFDSSLVPTFWQWSQEHLHIVLSYGIGFLVGVRLA
jgi:uncharacterized membrane protein (Fun14 family)